MATAYFCYIQVTPEGTVPDHESKFDKPVQITPISHWLDVGEEYDGEKATLSDGKWIWLGLVVYSNGFSPTIKTDPVEFKEILERCWDSLDNSKV